MRLFFFCQQTAIITAAEEMWRLKGHRHSEFTFKNTIQYNTVINKAAALLILKR